MGVRKRSTEQLADWVRDREYRRQLHRARIHIPVELVVGSRRIEGKIVDLSSGGFRVETDAPIGDERPIQLLRNGEPLQVEIRWADDQQLGGVFTDPADLPDW